LIDLNELFTKFYRQHHTSGAWKESLDGSTDVDGSVQDSSREIAYKILEFGNQIGKVIQVNEEEKMEVTVRASVLS
jgi:hypothetical protein